MLYLCTNCEFFYGGVFMQNNGKGLSVAGLVLGICAVVIGFIANMAVGIVCGIIGIVLSVMGRKKATLAGAPTGMATAGLVLSIIATAVCAVVWLAALICVSAIASAF